MNIKTIKERMLTWHDFLGGEILYTDEIKKAKSKKQLGDIMERYITHLEGVGNDTIKHAENFKRSLKLTE